MLDPVDVGQGTDDLHYRDPRLDVDRQRSSRRVPPVGAMGEDVIAGSSHRQRQGHDWQRVALSRRSPPCRPAP